VSRTLLSGNEKVQAGVSVSRPNIIVILADEMSYGDVGCYGAKEIHTPNLDKMAAEGMRFTSFCAPAPSHPSPTRFSTPKSNFATDQLG
jgi:arylsulfatase A